MIGNCSRVAAARPADMEPLISVMVLAFAADPVARWMYRDAQRYLAYFGRFIRAFAGKAFSTGTAWCIDGNLGGALWLPPGVKPDEDAIAAIVGESVPRDVMPDVNNMFGGMAIYHPRDPHCYLPTIGIEPHLHRKGLGSALLTEAGATRSTCRPTWNPATPPTCRYTSGSASRCWASYVRAIRRQWSRCCGAHADALRSK
jgi:ribosomal protein S18 acetylase RimI-like enzyme